MLTTLTRNASASDENTLKRIITNVLASEADAIHAVIDETRESLAAAVNLIFQSSGPLIVSGVGKSGHIARKIALEDMLSALKGIEEVDRSIGIADGRSC